MMNARHWGIYIRIFVLYLLSRLLVTSSLIQMGRAKDLAEAVGLMPLHILFVGVGLLLATIGSVTSIKSDWHEERYWARFVRPFYLWICNISGIGTGTIIFLARERVAMKLVISSFWLSMISLVAVAVISFLLAFELGRLIYGVGRKV